MARVVIENLSKIFRGPRGESIHAVRDLHLTIEDGEFLVLVGPSGCGKTTTLRLIAGLEEANGGSLSLDGAVVTHFPPTERDVAMVFQNLALYPHMTVRENMAFGLKLRKHAPPEIERAVRETAGMLGLTDCLGRMPGELSGGQRQRVALGRAIVRRPRVFLFDEPLSNLDVPARARMRGELLKWHAQLGATMIYVTHDQTEAMTLGGRMVVMNEGRVQQTGGPMEVYSRPANVFVAGFLGSPPMNFFRGALEINGQSVVFRTHPHSAAGVAMSLRLDAEKSARLAGHTGRSVILGIRPEHIALAFSNHEGAINGKLEAQVERVETIGPETHLFLTSGDQSFVARVGAGENIRANSRIVVGFDARHARFFDPVSEQAIA